MRKRTIAQYVKNGNLKKIFTVMTVEGVHETRESQIKKRISAYPVISEQNFTIKSYVITAIFMN